MPTSTDWSRPASDPRFARAPAADEVALRTLLAKLSERLPAGAPARAALDAAAAEARAAAAAVDRGEALRVAVTTLLAEALALNSAQFHAPPPPGVVESAARAAGLDLAALRLEVATRTVSDARLAALPPAAAIRAILSLVEALAPVAHVSLWRRASGRLRCLGCAGAGSPPRSVREAAAHSLDVAPSGSRHGLLRVVPVPGCGDAVLIARPRRMAGEAVPPFLRPAARALAPVLKCASELEREAPSADVIANASERRLERIGFDLHDGPIQSLAALIGDTRLLRSQVAELLHGDARERLVEGRVGDLQARMVALEFELRCMSHSLESPAVPCRPLERVIEHEIVAFQRQSGIRPTVELSGDFSAMSASQRIALLRIVQEALRNVGEHSGAHSVAVRIQTTADGIEALVEDDGKGFDVDAALARAVHDGRLGLIGMIERVRLLGGRCELRSRPGGPSAVWVLLPPWEPAQPVAA
jgi:signal transduction histidine kinase